MMQTTAQQRAHPDVRSSEDVHTIVAEFYGTIKQDPVLGSYFEDVDMVEHIPRLVTFWSSIVFQSGTYRGRPFDAHVTLQGLEARHFGRWLDRFEKTVDAHFAGENADRMKQRAQHIATIFQIKLGVQDDKVIAHR